MNIKRKNFIISNSILVAFIVIMVLLANYYLVFLFGFNEDTFIVITLVLIIFAIVLNYFLSKPLFDPLFASDTNLEKAIKETLHELNIPASTIQSNAQMLEKNLKDEKDIRRLNRIKLATNELLKLYDQMEYEIKKEIGRIDKFEFLLDEIIENSIDKFEDIKGSITIENDIKNISINSDKNGFQKVFDNLLSNAIKYNCENGIIKINMQNNLLCIFNTGNVIDTKNLFIVFEQYFQEDSNKTGFGLGLNIVKEFCDKNQIDIKIEPKENGTEIKLNLSKVIS
ncbi:integral membrane sensor signal transduction histidine kinase [Arcobacter nitrofigilis DSM 7299]|uniref:histidine kinase n=1 Tax=Arcobacter nitrofigilis (strain ATCC 33309 / DSM 7299 / CCUG 15893 / LMG 7604 / NCTC 12251 / CI) TaxID=572480 RepID=D5V1S7_ARCNC|nr:HAMP domain-containing sensor histidine kinase [Arcobacter nitrofigilis]ADG93511.1 integral membrane sensor signal transduction histidine kinase [Arcobacter nitrofigilis DSM 7299]